MPLELTGQPFEVGVVVQDREKGLRFYRDLLGLPVVRTMELPDGILDFLRVHEDCNLKVRSFTAPRTTLGTPGLPGEATGYRYVTFRVSNLDAALADIRAAGHAVLREPYEGRPGIRVAFVADPEGNAVEIVQEA